MKYIVYFFFGVVLCLSCEKEEKLKSDFYLEVRDYSEETVFLRGKEQAVYLWSTKSWADNGTATIEYIVDQSVLDDYNTKNGKQLKMLPADAYKAEKSKFEVTDKARQARFKVMVSPEKIFEYGTGLEKLEYAIPYRILVNGNKGDDKLTTVVVGFTVTKPYIYVDGDTIQEFDFITTKHIEVAVPISLNFRNLDGITPIFSYSPPDVEKYNKLNATNYHALPQSAVSWIKEDIVLARNVQNRVSKFTVAFEQLPLGTTLIPITIIGAEEPGHFADPTKNRKLIKLHNFNIPQTEWTAYASSRTGEGDKSYVLDNNVTGSSFWHAAWGGMAVMPSWIALKLKDESKIAELSSITMYTRQGNTWGNKGQKVAEILLSIDGVSWNKVATYNFLLNKDGSAVQTPQMVSFAKTKTRFVKINVTEKFDDGICFQEIYMRGIILNKEN